MCAGARRLALGLLFRFPQLGRAAALDLEVDAAALGVDGDSIARLDLSGEHQPRELVLDEPLDGPPERTGAELRVEPLLGEEMHGVVGELDVDPLRDAAIEIARADLDLIQDVDHALEVLHGKWKVRLLFVLARGVHRSGARGLLALRRSDGR